MGFSASTSKHKEESIYFGAYKSIKNMFEIMQLYKSINNISFKAFLISTKSIPDFMDIIKKSEVLKYLNNKYYLKFSEDKLNKELTNYKLEDNIIIYCEINELKKISQENDEKENEFIIVDELFCRIMKIKEYFHEYKKLNITIEKSIWKIKTDEYSDIFKFTPKENGIYGIYKFINSSNQ